jgi:hypothetical protein
MYGRLMFCATALLFASALPSEAQTRAGARTAPPIRFQEMDRNQRPRRDPRRMAGQRRIVPPKRLEPRWHPLRRRSPPRRQRACARPRRFSYDTPEYGFNDWTPRQFAARSQPDGRIARKEWRLDRELFRRVDRNGDNFVSRAEFNRMPQQLFSSADVNRDGFIEANEWRGARATFDRRDLNHDGHLTRAEFAGSGSVEIPGNTPVGTSGSHSPAYSAGYGRGVVEARAQAREDRVRNQGYDPEGQRELETADSGYDPRFGPKAEYQAGYRDGWHRGYPEGWRQP